MNQTKELLKTLILTVCEQLKKIEIRKSPVWTVVNSSGSPHLAMDPGRPATSDLLFHLSVGLLSLPEYDSLATAIEKDPEFEKGVIIDAAGILRGPERDNMTRALATNFLWRYLREGNQLDWDESRFNDTFNELQAELQRKSIIVHTISPLSNLRTEVVSLDFTDNINLRPAKTGELERWINRDQGLPPLGMAQPPWTFFHIDKPAVLQVSRTITGSLSPTDPREALRPLPPVDTASVISALRLAFDAPVSVIFQQQTSEGMMAFGGLSTSWSGAPPAYGPTKTLDQDKVDEVLHVWNLLHQSHNLGLTGLALRRWESSLLRQSLEDRLIDAWIGLEALLLGGKGGELSYRSAILLSEFLGVSGTDRKKIFDAMRISYNWRSAVVHGLRTKRLARTCSLEEAVRATTSYLRSALLKALELPGKFSPDKLETDLLQRESRS